MSDLNDRLDELFPLTRPRPVYDNLTCNTIGGRHGPTDAYGICPWCNEKVEAKAPKPMNTDKTDLGIYYEYYYNPDGP